MFRNKWIVGVLAVLFIGLVLYGCGKVAETSSNPTAQTYSVLNGTVKDLSGAAISSVTVTTSGTSAATNDQGYFSLSNITTTREIVTFSKTGKLTLQKIANLTPGAATFIDAVMIPANASQSFTVAVGGNFSDVSTTGLAGVVSLPGSALVTSAGVHVSATSTANIAITPFDPTITPEAFLGGYSGVNAAGTAVPFESFGYMDVTITDASGNPLSLGSGKTATITLKVAPALTPEAAALGTIPLWFYDSTAGTWKEQGIATYDAIAMSFVGIVAHFSPWNCDYPYTTASVKGRVVDSNGNPVSGAEVRLQATNNNWSNSSIFTGTDGKFGPVAVQAGVSFIGFATKGGIRSANKSFGAVAAGQTSDVGDIVLDAPLVQITLTWGLDPRDLDSHLTVPASTDSTARYDLYYGNRSSTPTDRWPSAYLDTDDTSSYGPEITSVYKLYKGTYRFNVHHYSGTSDITDSGANVNLIITGGGTQAIYNFTPPAGLTTGTGDVWQVFDIDVDSNGRVTAVTPLNGVLHSISASDHNSFSPGTATTIIAASAHAAATLIKK